MRSAGFFAVDEGTPFTKSTSSNYRKDVQTRATRPSTGQD
jgi:hypothetical protein